MLRTHTCGEITKKDIWKKVELSGWVSNRRDHWGIIFIDLRDRYWLTQVVFDPENDKKSHALADSFRSEYVIQIKWLVRPRPDGQNNPNLLTWEIEIITNEVILLSKSKTPPFEINEHHNKTNEEVRYKYRYIDLRRKYALDNVIYRSNFLNFTRNWFLDRDFLDVQTPIFTSSSPEWARDFLIPSRLHQWKFYALPQAPQQYKQLLMVWWIDKYFQIAPCFRDEDPRADRHACEFYQIDCEMSFVEQKDVFDVVEKYIFDVVSKYSDKKILENKIFSMTHAEATEKYGSDKPDLRYDMKLIDVIDIFERSTNEIFLGIAKDKEKNRIKAIKVTNWDNIFSKTQMKNFEKYVRQFGAKWLWYFQMKEDGLKWPLNKFFSEEDLSELIKLIKLEIWDVVFFWAWEKRLVCDYMWRFRVHLADIMNLVNKDELSFCWITDFPMFEENEITWKIDFWHNPFSMPKWWIKAFDKEDLLEIESVQYDLTCNWYEILSWSIRNHDVEALVKAFEMIGRTKEEVKEKFWAMYRAFQYWPPPHWWFAMWIDRFMMILKNEQNIREIYAFPKSWKAQDVMMSSPSVVDDEQLNKLGIKIIEEE